MIYYLHLGAFAIHENSESIGIERENITRKSLNGYQTKFRIAESVSSQLLDLKVTEKVALTISNRYNQVLCCFKLKRNYSTADCEYKQGKGY